MFNSVQFIQQEWHPDNKEKITHEPDVQTEYHNYHEEFSKTQEDQEIIEIPQSFPANTSEVPLEEVQDEIKPQNQPIQYKEESCTSVLRKKKTPSLLTKEEIDLVLNRLSASKPSFEPNASTHLPTPSICIDTKNKHVDQLNEEQTGDPICLTDEIAYSDDFPNFN